VLERTRSPEEDTIRLFVVDGRPRRAGSVDLRTGRAGSHTGEGSSRSRHHRTQNTA